MAKLFGTDGVRGLADDFFKNNLAKNIGSALGIILKREKDNPSVVIGGDTRESYNAILNALTSGLCEFGIDVSVVGTVPTPAIAYFTANCGFDAGIMISASHNPHEYNGIKIFAKGGFKLSDAAEEEIEELIFKGISENRSLNQGNITNDSTLRESYINHLKSHILQTNVDIFAVIDCANGSASSTAKEIFSFLGDKTVFIGDEPDGSNINKGCGSTHISLLADKVLELGADIGLAFDGDADRFLAVDETGTVIDGDFILAILADSLREKGRLNGNAIVGTIVSNFGLSKFAEANGYNFLASKVGDRYVLEDIEKNGYSLGGEQSGHTIIREAATTGDGQLTALYILSRMTETGKSLSSLAAAMKRFPQHTVNIRASNENKVKIKTDKRISEIISDIENSLAGSGRIIVRPSGTEPVARIMVESIDESTAVSLCLEAARRISSVFEN